MKSRSPGECEYAEKICARACLESLLERVDHERSNFSYTDYRAGQKKENTLA